MRGHRTTRRRPAAGSTLPTQSTLGGTQSVTLEPTPPTNPTSTTMPQTTPTGTTQPQASASTTRKLQTPSNLGYRDSFALFSPTSSSTSNSKKKPSPFEIPAGGMPPKKRAAISPRPEPSLFGSATSPPVTKSPPFRGMPKGASVLKPFEAPSTSPQSPPPSSSKRKRPSKKPVRDGPPIALYQDPATLQTTTTSQYPGRFVSNIPAWNPSGIPLQFPTTSTDLDFEYPAILLADAKPPDFEKDDKLKTKKELLYEIEYLKAVKLVNGDQIEHLKMLAQNHMGTQSEVDRLRSQVSLLTSMVEATDPTRVPKASTGQPAQQATNEPESEKYKELRRKLIAVGSRSQDFEDEKIKYFAQLQQSTEQIKNLNHTVQDLAAKLLTAQSDANTAQKQVKALQSADPVNATAKEQEEKIKELRRHVIAIGSKMQDFEDENIALRKAAAKKGSDANLVAERDQLIKNLQRCNRELIAANEANKNAETKIQFAREATGAETNLKELALQEVEQVKRERDSIISERDALKQVNDLLEQGKSDEATKAHIKSLEDQVKHANAAREQAKARSNQLLEEALKQQTMTDDDDPEVIEMYDMVEKLHQEKIELEAKLQLAQEQGQSQGQGSLQRLQDEHKVDQNRHAKEVYDLQLQLAAANTKHARVAKELEDYKSKTSTVPKAEYDALVKEKHDYETQVFDRQEFTHPQSPLQIAKWFEKLWNNVDAWAANLVLTSERILERAKEDPESVVPFRRFLARHPEIVLDSGKFGDEEITLIGAAMMKFLEEEIILQNPYPELQQTLMDLMDIEEHMKENKHLRRSERTAANFFSEAAWSLFDGRRHMEIRENNLERIFEEVHAIFGFLEPGGENESAELTLRGDIINEALLLNEAIFSSVYEYNLSTPAPHAVEAAVRESQDDDKLDKILKTSGVMNYADHNRKLNWDGLQKQWGLRARPTRKEIQDGLTITSIARPMLTRFSRASEEAVNWEYDPDENQYDFIWRRPRELLVEPKYLGHWAPKDSAKKAKPFTKAEPLMSLLVGAEST